MPLIEWISANIEQPDAAAETLPPAQVAAHRRTSNRLGNHHERRRINEPEQPVQAFKPVASAVKAQSPAGDKPLRFRRTEHNHRSFILLTLKKIRRSNVWLVFSIEV